jgi:hypothetical protein
MSKRGIFDYSNTCYGNNCLNSTILGANNNAGFGAAALTNNTIGDDNSAFGYQSLTNNITGSGNSSFGSSSLYNLISGSKNTVAGYNTGYSITNGVGNVIIGYNAGSTLSTNESDTLVVANSSTSNLLFGDFSSQKIGFCYGNGSITGALSYDVSIDGQSNKSLGIERNLTTNGKNFTLTAGGAGINTSNGNGGDLILQSGLTTGTGSSKMVFSISDNSIASSATTDNTYIDRMIILPPKKLSIAKSTAVDNPLFTINVPVGKVACGVFELGIVINTSSNFQSLQDTYMYTVINKGGTITSNFSNMGAMTNTTVLLVPVTVLMSFVNGTNQVIVKPTVNVGAVTGTLANSYAYVNIRNNSNSSITVT